MVLARRFKRVLFVHGCRLLAAALLMATGNGAWGAEPQITLSANQLNFAAQIQETASAQQLVVVTNGGQADLSITGIAIGGETSPISCRPTTVQLPQASWLRGP